jgi:hypothetical protein
MTEWLAKLPARRRVILVFWLLNALLAVALLAYALR